MNSKETRAPLEKEAVQSCVFCEIVGEVEDLDEMDPRDERMYLAHLKRAHGLER